MYTDMTTTQYQMHRAYVKFEMSVNEHVMMSSVKE